MTSYRNTTEITRYHAHIYYGPSTRDAAELLRAAIAERFTVELGRLHDRPIGPHPAPQYQVEFAVDELAKLLPWLMLNRGELSILVHPRTGDEIADHRDNPLWLGTPLPLDIEFLRAYLERRASSAPA